MKLNLVLAGMVGSLATLLIIVACGSADPNGHGQDNDDVAGDDDVGPQESSVLDCTQWELSRWNWNGDESCLIDGEVPIWNDGEACDVPEGWEPLGDVAGSLFYIMIRRCVSTA